jgi:hypothetical protein
MKCEKCGHEIAEDKSRTIKVPELKIEVETNLHTERRTMPESRDGLENIVSISMSL